MTMPRRVVGLALLCVASATGTAWSQTERSDEIDYERYNSPYDGRFTFVRLRYSPLPGFSGGGGFWRDRDLKWDHDYPRAERNLLKILDELTELEPRMDRGNILAVDDPQLFRYPVAYLVEAGFWSISAAEAESLRNYLLKGGFLIVDDFAGGAWFNFERRMRDVLPEARLVPLDVSHPIFHSFFEIETLDHTHPYYGVKSMFYGVFEDNDPNERLMVIVNYNNDIGESWEWSDTGFIPIELSNEAYKLGVNYIVYAMTH